MLGPIFVNIVWLYLFCYLGTHLTEKFSHFGDAIYQLDWYMFPMSLQKDLPIALALVQKGVFLKAYGGIGCTLEVFQKVYFLESIK